MKHRSPRRFYHSLNFKILLLLLLVFFSCDLLQLLLFRYLGKDNALKIDQQINWELATEVAIRIQPLLVTGQVSNTDLTPIVDDLVRINPGAVLYLLDNSGGIKFASNNLSGTNIEPKSISLAGIHKALENRRPQLPLFNQDQLSLEGKNIFSVARVKLGNNLGYVYITLQSQMAEVLDRIYSKHYFIKKLLPFTFSSVLIILFLGSSFSFYLSRHFMLLRRQIKRFEDGDLESRTQITSGDEIEFLSRTVNMMADAIVTKQQTLENLSKRRRELIANIAHDLRGPLTAISGFLELILIKSGKTDIPTIANYLQTILKNTNLLQQLLLNLRELSHLDAREADPQIISFSIVETINDIFSALALKAAQKKIRLVFNAPDQIANVLGDQFMLSRVLTNLIGNAIHYTPPEGRVEVTLQSNSKMVEIAVSDTGIGIPEEDLELIFKEFFRSHKGQADDPGGTGLGLAIVRRILELHNAPITVKSKVGLGTTFVFNLPSAENTA